MGVGEGGTSSVVALAIDPTRAWFVGFGQATTGGTLVLLGSILFFFQAEDGIRDKAL